MPMKPTQEQIDRIRIWLDARLHAIFSRDPFPRLPIAIEEDLKSGVDFSAIFQTYGFTGDGVRLLSNFHEIHVKSERDIKS
jgi:hypothetical protein